MTTMKADTMAVIRRERLTEALVRDLDTAGVVEWVHALQDREAELEAEVERLAQSRSAIARGLEREEELNADLEAENARLRTAIKRFLGKVKTPQPGEPWSKGDVRALGALRAALAEEEGGG